MSRALVHELWTGRVSSGERVEGRQGDGLVAGGEELHEVRRLVLGRLLALDGRRGHVIVDHLWRRRGGEERRKATGSAVGSNAGGLGPTRAGSGPNTLDEVRIWSNGPVCPSGEHTRAHSRPRGRLSGRARREVGPRRAGSVQRAVPRRGCDGDQARTSDGEQSTHVSGPRRVSLDLGEHLQKPSKRTGRSAGQARAPRRGGPARTHDVPRGVDLVGDRVLLDFRHPDASWAGASGLQRERRARRVGGRERGWSVSVRWSMASWSWSGGRRAKGSQRARGAGCIRDTAD
mgnify:CR=1 FL=1